MKGRKEELKIKNKKQMITFCLAIADPIIWMITLIMNAMK